jgi:hypothetical protein
MRYSNRADLLHGLRGLAVACLAITSAGCATVITTDGTIRHFGVTRVYSVPVQTIESPDSGGEILSVSTVGAWIGRGGGIGYRALSQTTLSPGCRVFVSAKDEEQLRAFIEVIMASDISREGICVGS